MDVELSRNPKASRKKHKHKQIMFISMSRNIHVSMKLAGAELEILAPAVLTNGHTRRCNRKHVIKMPAIS